MVLNKKITKPVGNSVCELYMRLIFLVFFFLPLVIHAQKIKVNEYDKFIRQTRIETFPVTVKDAADVKMSVSYNSSGPDFYLQVSGTGLGANIIDQNDKLILLLDNGATVTLPSKGYQNYDINGSEITYNHGYVLSLTDLEKLGGANVLSLKKSHEDKFDEVVVAKESANKLKTLSLLFKNEIKKSEVSTQNTTTVNAPGFPGGYAVWLNFLNRNLKPPLELGMNEKKKVIVEFLINANGIANDFRIIESPGPSFDTEVLRVLKRMPKWKPALENNRPTDAYVVQSISFSRSDSTMRSISSH